MNSRRGLWRLAIAATIVWVTLWSLIAAWGVYQIRSGEQIIREEKAFLPVGKEPLAFDARDGIEAGNEAIQASINIGLPVLAAAWFIGLLGLWVHKGFYPKE